MNVSEPECLRRRLRRIAACTLYPSAVLLRVPRKLLNDGQHNLLPFSPASGAGESLERENLLVDVTAWKWSASL